MLFRHLLSEIKIKSFFVLLFPLLVLSACGGHVYHVVERGETLYSIGFAYGYDYRQVAQWNGIKSPYYLSPGQRLRVVPPAGRSAAPLQEYNPDDSQSKNRQGRNAAPVIDATSDDDSDQETSSTAKQNVQAVVSKVQQFFNSSAPAWSWPTKEKRILQTFSSKDPSRQGLDFSGEQGSPVYAAASGRVVYAGSGLVHYGKLIIVKHSEKYLSAYAHNNELHVKEGDAVKAGQKIADMGSVVGSGGKNIAKLHFEIRRNGKPVDPLRFLPRK